MGVKKTSQTPKQPKPPMKLKPMKKEKPPKKPEKKKEIEKKEKTLEKKKGPEKKKVPEEKKGPQYLKPATQSVPSSGISSAASSTISKSDPSKTPEKKKKPLKQIVLFSVLCFIILALTIALVIVGSKDAPVSPEPPTPTPTQETVKPRNVCETPACITLAQQLHDWQNTSVDPCHDFYKYSCGRYKEHVEFEGPPIYRKNNDVKRMVKEFLLNNENTTIKSEVAMKALYTKCEQSKLDMANSKSTREFYKEIREKMLEIDVATSGMLDETKLLKSLFIVAHPVGNKVNLGLFTLRFSYDSKIYLEAPKIELFADEIMDKYHSVYMSGILPYTMDIVFDEDTTRKVLKLFKVKLYIEQKQTSENTWLEFGNSGVNYKVPQMNFERLLRKLKRRKSVDFENLRKKFFVSNVPMFISQNNNILSELFEDHLEDLTYFLRFVFLDISFKKWKHFSADTECHEHVMELLPQESLQFFARNYFNKKNLKDVTNVVEKTRSSFVEMMKESNVLKENKQQAIQKVENIKSVIGYSDGNDVSGNSSYSVYLSPHRSYFEMMRTIDNNYIQRMIDFASLKSSVHPYALNPIARTEYSTPSNYLSISAPIIDNPLFDSTYPRYAKIAGIGNIIGYGMGHGFDRAGKRINSNGDLWSGWTKEEEKMYFNRTTCLFNQYNTYDYFENWKLPKETFLALDDIIANNIGSDIGWKVFKKEDVSQEPKIIGFEDYSIEKLYFRIGALNWCSSPTHQYFGKNDPVVLSFRVNGVYSNMNSFAETFNCPVGSRMNPKNKTISREYLFDSSTTATPTTTRPITSAPGTGEPVTNAPATDEPATDEPATEAPVISCETCEISTIAPTLTDSATAFTSKELSATGECKTTQVKCARTDDQLCTDVKMTANGSPLEASATATDVTATLTCAEDGTYSSGTMEMAYPCKQAEVTCSRTDSLLCQSIALLGNGIPFGTVSESRSINSVVYCGEDATYSSGPAASLYSHVNSMGVKIRRVSWMSYCIQMIIILACDACDITTIAPSSIEAGASFQHRDDTELNGCRQIYVFCQRDDSKVCSTISIKRSDLRVVL
ncbi:hypothetical protein CRE_06590 [Caenorhabditis remanei]|uniref:Peptidase M13 N-terminal domain-containing protein n=1 Tax=Caenorhabditis remanei TaxID=31234 RepID=E3M1P1_CAERE|nr:hypothetical protein CRE_06590 [Caenorhabditis remanei]